MDVNEFSNQFDLLLNQQLHFGERFDKTNPIVIDEYEKSLFLTNAQEQLFLELYTSYELNEFNRRALAPLSSSNKVLSSNFVYSDQSIAMGDFNSFKIKLPVSLAFVLNEQLLSSSGRAIDVQPIKIDQYNTLRNNPFRQPNYNSCWRIDNNTNYSNSSVNNKNGDLEIITSYGVNELNYYICTYLKYPDPIVLVNLEGSGLSIGGKSSISEACLNNITHEQILKIAVDSAILSINKSKQ